jgi:hypothetical protein
MKKFLQVLCVVIVLAAVFAVPVFAQEANPPVAPASDLTVPSELQALLAMVIGYVVTQGLKSLSQLLHADISGWGSALSASIVTGVVLFFNALLSAVPDPARASVAVALTLLVTVLGAFGVHATVKTFKA